MVCLLQAYIENQSCKARGVKKDQNESNLHYKQDSRKCVHIMSIFNLKSPAKTIVCYESGLVKQQNWR